MCVCVCACPSPHSSFDRKVQVFGMSGAGNEGGRAPKWFRRPVGASFGFGGKLVSFGADGASKPNFNQRSVPKTVKVWKRFMYEFNPV